MDIERIDRLFAGPGVTVKLWVRVSVAEIASNMYLIVGSEMGSGMYHDGHVIFFRLAAFTEAGASTLPRATLRSARIPVTASRPRASQMLLWFTLPEANAGGPAVLGR